MAEKTLTPIYLARPMREGEDQEEYEIGIAQNEENLNQNLNHLYNRILRMEGRIDTKEDDDNGGN